MTWLISGQFDRAAIAEIESLVSDRAVAIVATALVEERLEAALRVKLHRDKTVVESMFRASGPLGTLSAKIDLGFLMGLYGRESHKDLDGIRRIRNEFAHNVVANSFQAQKIRDLSLALQIADRNFRITAADAKKNPDIKPIDMFTELDPSSPNYARGRFMRACQICVSR